MALHKKLVPKIKLPTQDRSERAVENILSAADAALHDADSLSARLLATKSGYSIGALYHYLSKAEDAFILALIGRRDKQFLKLVELIDLFPSDQPLVVLLEAMVDSSFREYGRMNRRSYALVFRMILRLSKNPLAFDDILKVLVNPLRGAQQRDQTGTFKETDFDELLLVLKIGMVAIRRPFLDQDPMAGSARHRAMAIGVLEHLLGKTSLAAE